MIRNTGKSKMIGVRFKEKEVNFINKKRKAGTPKEITASEYIRGRTLKVTCECGKPSSQL